MLFSTDKNHHEKCYVKNIPGPQVGPPDNVSFSSLPVSESEDEPGELNAYFYYHITS